MTHEKTKPPESQRPWYGTYARIPSHIALLLYFATRPSDVADPDMNLALTAALGFVLAMSYVRKWQLAGIMLSAFLMSALVLVLFTRPGAESILVFAVPLAPVAVGYYWYVLLDENKNGFENGVIIDPVLLVVSLLGILPRLVTGGSDRLFELTFRVMTHPLGILAGTVLLFILMASVLRSDNDT